MKLQGKRIALLVAKQYQDEEVTEPLAHLRKNGATVDLIGLEYGEIPGKYQRAKVTVEKLISEIKGQDYDALVIPGGQAPESLRLSEPVLGLVREFMAIGKPVAAICHGPQVLISAGVVDGRHLTSYIGIRDDLKVAGAQWVDESAVVDGNLLTSRSPKDIPDFLENLEKMLLQQVPSLLPVDLSPSEAVSIAIGNEINAVSIYTALAAHSDKPAFRAKFNYLATEEKGHRLLLEELYHKMTSKKHTLPKGFIPIEVPNLERPNNLGEVLKMAMQAEENSRQFYFAASQRATHPETKQVFTQLAWDEIKHKELLEIELGLHGRRAIEMSIESPAGDMVDLW